MLIENPYRSPVIPAEAVAQEWPPTGVFCDGPYLVLHHAAALPPLCVKTGRSAELQQPFELVGGLPNDDSVQATRHKWLAGPVYEIVLPLSHQALHRARLAQRAGLGVGLISLVGLVFTVLLYAWVLQSGLATAVHVGLLLGFVGSAALLGEAQQHLHLECVARGYFWISKVPRAYLRQLPVWPVPRPAWWRRALFGPAGVSTPATRAAPVAAMILDSQRS